MRFSTARALFVVCAIVAALFVGIAYTGSYFLTTITGNEVSSQSEAAPTVTLGSEAPYFDLPNLVGDHVSLGALTGSPVVILFWSTTNSESRDALHIIDEYLGSSAPTVPLAKYIAISSQEEKSVVNALVRRGGYTVPVLIDRQGVATNAYGVKGLPTFYFVDAAGVLRAVHAGPMSEKMIVDNIEELLTATNVY